MKGHIHYRRQHMSTYAMIMFAPFLVVPCPMLLQACAWLIALYHGLLGLMVVVEDYVPATWQAMTIRFLQLITSALALRVVWYIAQQTFR